MEGTLLEAIDQQATHAISGIHDIRTAINLLYRNTESIVAHFPGDSMEEKISEAPADMKRLLISVRLLKSRLDMASIAKNPESATFGRPRPAPVYRIFHRMVRLFEQEAHLKDVTIRMRGSSFRAPLLYDSFETVPLVLLDNAVKYANPNSEIVVLVEDRLGHIAISVTSTGPIVPRNETAKIFDKAFRSESAKRFAASGSGLGLHIAGFMAMAFRLSLGAQNRPGVGRLGQPW